MGVVFYQAHAMKTVLINCRTVFVARGPVFSSQSLSLSAKHIRHTQSCNKGQAQASTGRWFLSAATCLERTGRK